MRQRLLQSGSVQEAVGVLHSFEVCPDRPQLVELRTIVGLAGVGVAIDYALVCDTGER